MNFYLKSSWLLTVSITLRRPYYRCDAQTNQDKRSSYVQSIGQNYN